jgi:hypothetical protein
MRNFFPLFVTVLVILSWSGNYIVNKKTINSSSSTSTPIQTTITPIPSLTPTSPITIQPTKQQYRINVPHEDDERRERED